MILVATIIADRKSYSQTAAIGNNFSLEGDRQLYVNVESGTPVGPTGLWSPLYDLWETHEEKVYWDQWSRNSNWHVGPTYDQDNARLDPIVIARNMALGAARSLGASHILFVDSDVVVPHNAIPKLLEVKKPVVGGLVHGRGAHAHAQYVFGVRATYNLHGSPVVICDHGTCGFMLIERKVFERVSFRWGPSWKDPKVTLSEDPAFCEDAERLGFGPMHIRMDVVGRHVDNPKKPLTNAEAVNNYITE